MTKYGICKECSNDAIELNEENRIPLSEIDLWECPTCYYPHDINDFMGTYEK
ncbi:MAG: hypothetical protein ACXADH_14740 [Candidatus Kariarchaeaceae archaeon]|jgi:hypothetical protein